MPLVDLCAPADLHSLFLLDVGDSSSLLRDPVPAHLAAPPRRALRGGVKTERRSGGRARGAAAQAHRDGVHVELVAGMSFFRSPAPSMPSPRPGLRRGGEAAEMAVGKPARRCGGPRRPLREVRPPLSPAATTQDPAPHGLLPAGSHGILLPAGFADMARGETTMRAAGVGIVESVGARDPSCSSTGEDEPYNGPPAVSSAWENGTEASPREATRRPSAGQSGGDLQKFHRRDGARDGRCTCP